MNNTKIRFVAKSINCRSGYLTIQKKAVDMVLDKTGYDRDRVTLIL